MKLIKYSKITDLIIEAKKGKMFILVDDENRENEGDLIIPASKTKPSSINFMAKYGRGLICLTLCQKQADKLNLSLMSPNNISRSQTAFTVSIDAKSGITTGISAADRAHTISVAINSNRSKSDIVSPGHIFPLMAWDGGVLERAGHTEAAVDISKLAGLNPSGVICEVMNEDGTMARLNDLEKITAKHGIRIISIAQIVAYRRANETLVKRVAETKLPTQYGEFKAIAYSSIIDTDEHIALVKGDISTNDPVLVRVHSQCLTGDTFGSQRCDCGEQIDRSLEAIQAEDRGVFLYMRQEGRGIGLHNKLRAYQLQDDGLDTVEANEKLGFPADLRWYGIGAQILVDLGIKRIRLLTNNPKKVAGLDGYGLEILERVPIQVPANKNNQAYLNTKLTKLGHLLDSDLLEINSQETVSPEV